MAQLLKGPPVANSINEKTALRAAALKEKGVLPTLAILRVGEREDDLSSERGAMKRCEQVGIAVKNVVLPVDVESDVFFEALEQLNDDPAVHGILMFRPLPRHLDEEKARMLLAPEKDVDGCTDGSLAGVFTGSKTGFPPCTAQSAVEILKYYGVKMKGKRAVVIGRSLVVGRPVAMMLLEQNATVTVCHSKTVDVPSITRDADIIVTATGQMESIDSSYLGQDQVIIDVGIGWNKAKGRLCGDVLFEDAVKRALAVTPVPSGVGSVTTSILASHCVEAAERTLGSKQR